MKNMDIVFIIIVVLCYVLAFSKRVRKFTDNSKLVTSTGKGITALVSRYYNLLLISVVAVAVLVRAWKFGAIPYGFNQDEAMAGLEAFSLAENGTDHYGMTYPVYFTAWISHQMNVLLSYILAPLFSAFGPSILIARIPLLIFSYISLYVVYRFTYKVFGKNAALVILFMVSINPWQIMISRWALEANLLPHLLLYGCYLSYLGLEKKRYLFISMVFFGVAMYAYGIAYYLVPIFLLMLCIFFIRGKMVGWYDVLICSLIYMVVSWPLFVMMFINFFQLETIEFSFMTIPFFEKGERLNDILFFSDGGLKQLGENLLYVVLFVFLQIKDRAWNSIPEIGPFYFVAIPLLILGFAFFLEELRKEKSSEKNGIIVIMLLFVASFISGLITNNVNLNRMNAICYPVLFMIGYAVYQIVKRLKITMIPIALMFSILFGSFCYSYFYGAFSRQLGQDFYKGFVESLQYVKELNYDKLYVTAKTQGDNAEFSSEILTQFLLKLDSEYTTGVALPEGESTPYAEKYQYGITGGVVDTNETGVVYIIREDELMYFDDGVFEIMKFENYCVITHQCKESGM